MIRNLKYRNILEEGSKTRFNNVIVAVVGPSDSKGIPSASSLAEDLKHRIFNITSNRVQVEVVTGEYHKQTFMLFSKGELLHKMYDPCLKSIMPIMISFLGHYKD